MPDALCRLSEVCNRLRCRQSSNRGVARALHSTLECISKWNRRYRLCLLRKDQFVLATFAVGLDTVNRGIVSDGRDRLSLVRRDVLDPV
jgi:hypothetical protein